MRDLRWQPWGFLLLISCLLSGCAFVSVSLQERLRPFQETAVSGEGKDKVLLISIGGVIGGVDPSPLRLVRPPRRPGVLAEVKEQLERAADDPRVKALVLRINSPGGDVTTSDTLFHEVMTFKRKTNARVVASIQDVGTSGAYYIALAGDRIVAHPTAVTGSIGVMTMRFDAQELMRKVGVEASIIRSGEKKDASLPFRPLSPTEREMLQEIIDRLHERFVGLVAERRKGIPPEQLKKIADGRIFLSQEAKALGLIDEVGYLEEAIDLAKKEAGLSKARVVIYHRPGEYRSNIYSLGPAGGLERMALPVLPDLQDLLPEAGFFYLWLP